MRVFYGLNKHGQWLSVKKGVMQPFFWAYSTKERCTFFVKARAKEEVDNLGGGKVVSAKLA